jgi:hypothetical protein
MATCHRCEYGKGNLPPLGVDSIRGRVDAKEVTTLVEKKCIQVNG